MQSAIRPLVIPGVSHLARRYVNWRERNVRRSLVKMRLERLRDWTPYVWPPLGVTIDPLSECGSEWLLRRVFNETAIDMPDFKPCRPIDVLAFSSSPLHDRRGVMLARAEGRYVGTSVARMYPDGTGTIASLSVHPDLRGKGIGTALLHSSLGYLKERRAHSAVLYVEESNEAARRLYLELGFTIVDTCREVTR